MDHEDSRQTRLLDLTTEIVSSYLRNQHLPRDQVPALIKDVHATLFGLAAPTGDAMAEVAPRAPAVNPKKSVQDDFIVCLEDGKKFKSLKRHLMTSYGLTPDQYRARWGLDASYPMVAPNYAATRSQLAKDMGLGRKPRGMVQ